MVKRKSSLGGIPKNIKKVKVKQYSSNNVKQIQKEIQRGHADDHGIFLPIFIIPIVSLLLNE